ncbi:FecCD family ABC transporter permease [Streptomyces goshikiensis]|uniref:FecCD family ABC transporter permease n=1 Tax=Streptomyces goshikiensis TaxID=1942 RepID=UPI001676BF8B|nr:iron ABC transporter permease [Streptomyces goshikiensis]GHD73009.1 iron ABC transporter permease [Streptomyces goshikiensis]
MTHTVLPTTAQPPPPAPARTRLSRGTSVLLLGGLLLAVVVIASTGLGARDISALEIVKILLHPGGSGYNHDVLWTERIPRTLLGLAVGASLGASGLVMQALTMNPLSDPGVLGVEQGAAMFVVLGILFLDVSDAGGFFWLALAGSAVTAALVYLIGTRTNAGSTTIGLVLAGVAIAAVLASLVTLLVVRDEAVYSSLRFWSVGQLTGRAQVLGEIAPFAVVGLLLALPLGRTLNLLSLGEESARGLGLRVQRAQLAAAAVAVTLCAAATAAVGPVAFVGLVAAHLARMLVGADHRWSLPLSMLCGAVLLVGADTVGRVVLDHGEVQVSVMTAIVGTPFFVWLARRRDLVRM